VQRWCSIVVEATRAGRERTRPQATRWRGGLPRPGWSLSRRRRIRQQYLLLWMSTLNRGLTAWASLRSRRPPVPIKPRSGKRSDQDSGPPRLLPAGAGVWSGLRWSRRMPPPPLSLSSFSPQALPTAPDPSTRRKPYLADGSASTGGMAIRTCGRCSCNARKTRRIKEVDESPVPVATYRIRAGLIAGRRVHFG
jgi:hypothetical protein